MIEENTARFDQLLGARDENFDNLRKIFFLDSSFIDYLNSRLNDDDAVTAFTARRLYAWAIGLHPDALGLDEFIERGIFETKAKQSKTAAGWQPATDVAIYIEKSGNRPEAVDHLLLLALYRPRTFYLSEGAQFYSNHFACSSPQVLIRLVLQDPSRGALLGLTTLSLRKTDRVQTIRAIAAEQARAKRLKIQFPEQLVALRQELIKTSDPTRAPT